MPEGLLATIAVGAFALAVLTLLIVLYLALRVRAVSRRRGEPTTGDPALDRRLAAERERTEALARELSSVAERVRRTEEEGRHAISRVGVVRFNPFEDTGGNQSFALALLDARADGVVISSLHARQGTRVYLKAVSGGRSDVALSEEETEALRRALGEAPASQGQSRGVPR